ncbi:uncharacterized protein LOC135476421 [Liolophura sinensis]|uniref:uncharacterized protein LOC135476421 n=1 Tax=Liolophura sinensis TaxID=3198878 RepID=UPI00315849FD
MYNRPVTPRQEWDTALILKDYVNSNLFYDWGSLNRSIENATYLVLENGVVVHRVPLLEREWSVCYFYDVSQVCENDGRCYMDDNGYPACSCIGEFYGDYCHLSGYRDWNPIYWVAMFVPLALCISLALCCTCYAIVAAIRKRKKKKEEENDFTTNVAGSFRIPRSFLLPPNWKHIITRSDFGADPWEDSEDEAETEETTTGTDLYHRNPLPGMYFPDEDIGDTAAQPDIDPDDNQQSTLDLINNLLSADVHSGPDPL